MEEKVRADQMQAKATKFRREHLLGRSFDSLKSIRKEVEDDAQRRSRMYTIFSAWKFYAKERTLLKRYLFECGESIGDVSQMTTMQMREVADRKKEESKANHTDMSGSSLKAYAKPADGSRMHHLSSISNLNSSANDHSAIEPNNVPTSVGLVLSRFSQNSARPAPQIVPTPSFVRESLPEMNMRQRHISPDIVFEEAVKRSKVEVRSAEQTSSRKRASTVLSLL